MPIDEINNTGLFVPTNFLWDINLLQDTKLDSPEFKELLIRLYQNINSMCIALNLKDSGYYVQQEFLNGQLLFPNPTDPLLQDRQIFRMVVNFGTLPNNTSISVPHNIEVDGSYSFTRIYGSSSDPINLNFIPLPYASSNGTDNIQLDVDATNVTLTTTIDYSAYTITYIVLEYVKS